MPGFFKFCDSRPGTLKFVTTDDENEVVLALFRKVTGAGALYEKGIEVVVWHENQVKKIDYFWFERNTGNRPESRPWLNFSKARIVKTRLKTRLGFKAVLMACKKTGIYYNF